MKVSIPYGRKHLTTEIDDKNILGVYTSSVPAPASDPVAEVERALDAPFGSPKLEELAVGKRTAVIIISDHTRPVPSKVMIPSMLARLRKGNPAIDITLLVATGCHRPTKREELVEKLGEDIVDGERIVCHDSADDEMMADIGVLPSGGRLLVNRLAVEADLLVSEGFIEPHFFAGFSGGRKSVLPGIASRESVLANHCSEFIADPKSRTGILEGNPIHKDMVYAADKVKLAFILNVVINQEKQVVKAFAGDHRKAHEAGCDFLRGFCRASIPEADIVITSNGGYPLDQNVYQSVKGMTAGEAVCRPGGVIILCASCCDGHGGNAFYKSLSEASSAKVLLDEILKVARNGTIPDQWQVQILARILCKCSVIMVTEDCDHDMLRAMGLEVASSLDAATALAKELVGEDGKIAVIPDGVSMITEVALIDKGL